MPITRSVLHGDDVDRLGVAAVAVGLERDTLLAAEHPLAQLERRGQLGVGAGFANLHGAGQRAYRSMSSASCLLARVAALVHERELALRVVEGGGGERLHGIERRRDLEVGVVEVLGTGQGARAGTPRPPAAVVGVDAEERDLSLALARLIAEDGNSSGTARTRRPTC